VAGLREEMEGVGAIVDDRYGGEALDRLAGSDVWLARPVERAGRRPVEFEADGGLAIALRAWPAAHVAKCLVYYSARDPEAVRGAQESALIELQHAAHATGHEWLLELIPPDGGAVDELVAPAMQRLYAAGLKPDWWKLPPSRDERTWRRIGDVVRAGDPFVRGIMVLGSEAPEADLARAFTAAAGEPLVRGFAVGRAIFWATAVRWFAGEIADAAAVSEVAGSFRRIAALWRSARPLARDERARSASRVAR
jgi:5-dehydro-2-deoxygluconokinase